MGSRWPRLVVLSGVLLLGTRLHAQTAANDPRTLDERLSFFLQYRGATLRVVRADDTARQNLRDELDRIADVKDTNFRAFTYYALPSSVLTDSFKEFLQSADKARVDQQLGSTSKAVKTGVAALASFALETGAVSQTINQNVATLRANAEGLGRFLSNQDVFATCPDDDAGCRAWSSLKNLELSASFNVSDADTKNLSGTTTDASAKTVSFASALTEHQFLSATARYAVMNPRDLRSTKYQQQWMAWFEKNRNELTKGGQDLVDRISKATTALNTDDYDKWLAGTRADLKSLETADPAPTERWKRALRLHLDELLDKVRKSDPEFDARFRDAAHEYMRYLALRRDLMATLVTDPALTIEYTYSEPQLQPRLHTVRVAWAYSPKAQPGVPNPGTITVNAGLDYYHDAQAIASATAPGVPAPTSHWKDAQVAVQFDRPLGPAGSASTFSASFYYQYQMNPNTFVLPPGTTTLQGTNITIPAAGLPLLSQAGSIAVAQATLTIRMASSGLKIPIGVSWSNRTELEQGNRFIGHIGFTFDSSPLLLMQALR